jgi:hypothetical protein
MVYVIDGQIEYRNEFQLNLTCCIILLHDFILYFIYKNL